MTASQVLHIFHRDEAILFLGAAFVTVSIIAAALCVIRRKADALLLWLAVFALLYGNRLWLWSGLLALIVPHSKLFLDLRATMSFVVAVPAFFFFQAAGFIGRWGKQIAFAMTSVMACLVVGTLVYGPRQIFQDVNNIVIVAGLLMLLVWSIRHKADRDFVIVRRGLVIFVCLALWDNIAGRLWVASRLEPYGFALFLGTLGYVAARRTIQQEQELGEIQKELEVAWSIQLSIMPQAFPYSPNFKVAARYVPMTSVAGDFYDFVVTDETEAGLLIADVSGHGVPAALIASMVKMAATSQRANAANPAQLLTGMNATLCGNTQSQFVTAAYVYLDARAGELRYAAAAHPPLLLLRDGEVREVVENGLMLAAFDSASYSSVVHPLAPGDRLVLYTDGIVEAEDGREEQFGPVRLCSLVRESAGMSPAEIADLILAAVERWSVRQDDDRTLLVCDYVGTSKT
ncbi:PP2C family protein-serine/threonine phosphatase [Edaphobacter bradus]|uniref:PP2C family protein-serine/threonine phosphatase n=1 Tax=Edaphobacter bradus TaxID=2259016 RepID=UPI0021E04BAF|nr:PP2C family protein-serine/threonine phosphatase [Edaphobacter bradus]